MREELGGAGVEFERVAAVDGAALAADMDRGFPP